jgi:orotate phosphoribosyltransferase
VTSLQGQQALDATASEVQEIGRRAAQILLDIGAVLFRPERPFFFSSGWASPVYVDCKRSISYPLARDALMELSIRRIMNLLGYDAIDGIAGAEGGGAPFASIIAHRLHLPLVVSRKHAVGIGPEAGAFGHLPPGRRLLLIDDVTTDGRTKSSMCHGLREAGYRVDYAFVLFKYGIFDSEVSEPDLGVELFSLATWQELLAVARERSSFDAAVLEEMQAYVADPPGWSARHGGISALRSG